jgi:NAD+ kinase
MTRPKNEIKRIGIVVNPTKTSAFPLIKQVVDWLVDRDIEVLLDAEVYDDIESSVKSTTVQDMPGHVDLIVAFGGDGTMLNVAQCMDSASTPLMGVKVGGLGFLTGVTEQEVFTTLEEVLAGQHRIERRLKLSCEVLHRDGTPHREAVALNDVVIQRNSLDRILTVETYVDREFLASYLCDGIIISTPTGSTAHSLSAGGPIVYPEAEAIVLTPICPHMLSNRPLVLSAEQELRAIVVSEDTLAGLMIDGQIAIELQPWDQVIVRKSPFCIPLVGSSNKSYFEVLRTKLNWGRR